jgi:hypothetical protein
MLQIMGHQLKQRNFDFRYRAGCIGHKQAANSIVHSAFAGAGDSTHAFSGLAGHP